MTFRGFFIVNIGDIVQLYFLHNGRKFADFCCFGLLGLWFLLARKSCAHEKQFSKVLVFAISHNVFFNDRINLVQGEILGNDIMCSFSVLYQ